MSLGPVSRVWGVLFTDEGLRDLDGLLNGYLSTGPIGRYLYCKQAEMHLSYFRVVVESRDPDGSSVEMEMFIPHRYVKAVVAATDKKKLGFT